MVCTEAGTMINPMTAGSIPVDEALAAIGDRPVMLSVGEELPAGEEEAEEQHLLEQDLDSEAARTLGLLRPGKQDRGDYDLFRGRLMFPIHDLQGRVVAFAGRVSVTMA